MKPFIVCAIFALVCACSAQPPPEPPGEPAPVEPLPAEPSPAEPPAGGGDQGACVPSGCSGTVCVEAGDEVVTTCEWREEYACYQQATCERQPDGVCGWTMTAELEQCLAQGGPEGR